MSDERPIPGAASIDHEPLDNRSQSTPPPPAKSRWKLIFALFLLAFTGGIAATLWGPSALQSWWNGSANQPEISNSAAPLGASVMATPQMATPTAPATLGEMEARLAALQVKLDTLTAQAQTAGSFAGRAESLLVTLATRRALDNGAPLGYLEGELRARFGDAQPRAVATVINAAREPVTLADLQSALLETSPALSKNGGKSNWWEATKRELSALVIIRKANAPSSVPQRAVENARTLLLAGRTEAALAEIERLPGHTNVESWIQMARRYNEARRALDVIEAAAILEPRSLALVPASPVADPASAPSPASAPAITDGNSPQPKE
jgi:hypothetical protein